MWRRSAKRSSRPLGHRNDGTQARHGGAARRRQGCAYNIDDNNSHYFRRAWLRGYDAHNLEAV
jgi:hypothetical protein